MPQQLLPANAESNALECCPDKCGDTSIPFPFGMTEGCFRPGFKVVCNHSFTPARAFLASYNGRTYQQQVTRARNFTNTSHVIMETSWRQQVEVLDISAGESEARVYGAVSSRCITSDKRLVVAKLQATRLREKGPFQVSPIRNILAGVGARVEATMLGRFGEMEDMTAYKPSCLSNLVNNLQFATNGSCAGAGCCVAVLPPTAPRLNAFRVGFMRRIAPSTWEATPCSYGMVVERSWHNFSAPDLYGYEVLPGRLGRGVPVVLDFAIGSTAGSSCPAEGRQPPGDYACVSGNSYCYNLPTGGYACKCWDNYHGNPYIRNGCQDIDECEMRKQSHELSLLYPCSSGGICSNRVGGYDCRCKPGSKGDAKKGSCSDKFPLVAKLAVGLSALVVVFVLMVMFYQRLKLKRFYEQNGGPKLKGVKNIRMYTRRQLKKITNDYKHVIGEGHFAKVYMGTLEDEQQVAIKISNKVDKDMKEEFISEVIIQSEMRHKNIVRLLGCCLQVNFPKLVYEYAPRGSLHDVLFGPKCIDSISVHTRLGIAVESAEGLTYMHSALESTIRHGDVKSANILLDNNFSPKVSDFGTTRLLARGKAEKTEHVIGSYSYIDPVYMDDGVVSQKSDVYSFGVILIELFTRKPAGYDKHRSYVANFVKACLDKEAKGLIDKAITSEVDIMLLEMVSEVAIDCLKPTLEERPDMKQVEQRLNLIIEQSSQHSQDTNYKEDMSAAPDDIPLLKHCKSEVPTN